MSTESVQLRSTSAASNSPQTQPQGGSAASTAGECGADGAGQTPAQGSGSGRSSSAPARGKPHGPADGSAATGDCADSKTAAAGAGHGAERPGKPAARAPRPHGSFSQALALSLAASGQGGKATADAHGGRGASKHATHMQAKDGKSDPVTTALTLLNHALSGAPSMGSGATAGAGTVCAKAQHTQGSDTPAPKALATLAKGIEHSAQTSTSGAAVQDLKGSGAPTAAAGASPASTPAAVNSPQTGLAAHSPAPAHAAAHPQGALSAPIGTRAWTDELGSQLTWMSHQGIQSATLQLSPEHLGPLQVSISVHHGQASVWFGAAHADTRQALEQALPQLRQMLSGQGLTLTDSGVSRESPRGQAQRKAAVGQIGPVAGDCAGAVSEPGSVRIGLVDAYV